MQDTINEIFTGENVLMRKRYININKSSYKQWHHIECNIDDILVSKLDSNECCILIMLTKLYHEIKMAVRHCYLLRRILFATVLWKLNHYSIFIYHCYIFFSPFSFLDSFTVLVPVSMTIKWRFFFSFYNGDEIDDVGDNDNDRDNDSNDGDDNEDNDIHNDDGINDNDDGDDSSDYGDDNDGTGNYNDNHDNEDDGEKIMIAITK